MLQVPIVKGASAVLAFMFLMLTQSLSIFFPSQDLIINSWDGSNQYQVTFNNEQLIIYLESGDVSDNPNESIDKHGKIKIIFKDDKSKGTTLIYEREIGGEISEQDQQYIKRILSNIEKFHKDNRTYNQIKDKLDGFWSSLKRK